MDDLVNSLATTWANAHGRAVDDALANLPPGVRTVQFGNTVYVIPRWREAPIRRFKIERLRRKRRGR